MEGPVKARGNGANESGKEEGSEEREDRKEGRFAKERPILTILHAQGSSPIRARERGGGGETSILIETGY